MALVKPRYLKLYGEKTVFCKETVMHCKNGIIKEYMYKLAPEASNGDKPIRHMHMVAGFPQEAVKKVEAAFNISFASRNECYVMTIDEETFIYAENEKGLFYGAVTLLQILLEDDFKIEKGIIYDFPVCPVRGVKVYLPHREDIGYFKKFVDMICYYKYNTIVIEVAGAMEYKSHPEINRRWMEYCTEMSEYSGKTKKIQENTYPWRKNSIHVENGGGGYLTQDEVRDMVSYCKSRFLKVIPEMPSLSHCDYLLLAHEELRERAEDPYPDTYCPSNPESYKLLFGLLDEVIDVFKPESIHMGHDEYYSIGLCEKCRQKKADQIFADDINKIYGYLAGRGIKMIIWGDKLLNVLDEAGNHGGAEITARDYGTGEYFCTIPATYQAIDKIPGDIEIYHWYWGVDKKLENEFLNRGLNTVYGNFAGHVFPCWKARISKGVGGGVISNWSRLKEENLQRNGFMYTMVYSCRMFWDPDFDDNLYDETRDMVLKELYRYKNSETAKSHEDGVSALKIVHTTDFYMEYRGFEDGIFIENDLYTLGRHVIAYDDGKTESIPVIYGKNISNKDVSWERSKDGKGDRYRVDNLLIEASLSTLPVKENGATWYEITWENPYPGKKIEKIKTEVFQKCMIIVSEIEFIRGDGSSGRTKGNKAGGAESGGRAGQ